MVKKQVTCHMRMVLSSPKPACGFLEGIFNHFHVKPRFKRRELVVVLLPTYIQRFCTHLFIVFLRRNRDARVVLRRNELSF